MSKSKWLPVVGDWRAVIGMVDDDGKATYEARPVAAWQAFRDDEGEAEGHVDGGEMHGMVIGSNFPLLVSARGLEISDDAEWLVTYLPPGALLSDLSAAYLEHSFASAQRMEKFREMERAPCTTDGEK